MKVKLIPLLCLALMLGLVGSNAGLGATLDLRISAGGNDAEEHLADGSMDITSTDLEFPYEDNANLLIDRFGCDPACADAGRFFWPCQDVRSVNMDPDAYTIDVIDYIPPPVIARPPTRHTRLGFILPKARRVIEQGCFPGEGRNSTSRWCYLHLRGKGYDPDSAFAAAFAKIDLPKEEIKAIQKSAEKFIAREDEKRLADEASLWTMSPSHPGES